MADAYNRALGGSLSGLLGMYEDWKAQPRMAAIGGLLMGDTKPAMEMLNSKPWPTQMPTGKSKMPEEQRKALMQEAVNVALDWNNPMAMSGLIGHTVWHGSPHKFDKFDMSKIGTGEGAQAYGHGLYFAEAPDVAQTYADSLGSTQFYANGAPLSGDSAWAAMHMADNGGNVKGILDWAKSSLKPTPEGRKAAASLVREARKLRGKEITEAEGQLYKVDIPDEILPRMLDWDKPLSQQSPEVQKALSGVDMSALNSQVAKKLQNGSGDGQTIYKAFGSWDDPSGASEALKQAGIPGIRYLDGNSRARTGGELIDVFQGPKGWHSKIRKTPSGTVGDVIPQANSFTTSPAFKSQAEAQAWADSQIGGGTSNFVLFDDRLPRIIERNGVPTGLKPWKDDPEALRGLLGM